MPPSSHRPPMSPSPAFKNHRHDNHQVLEINLISAQDLKSPSSPRRRLQTYAITWIDPMLKLRTRVDQIGGENPTWNDKFLFRVSPEFLAGDTSAVSVAIYSVGLLRDQLIGTVRFLVGNIPRSAGMPSFSAVQIRRPSGNFQGVMNIGAMILDSSAFPTLSLISAIGYRDLIGKKDDRKKKKKTAKKKAEKSKCTDEMIVRSESCDNNNDNSNHNSCAESLDLSDGEESSTSSSSTVSSTALKEWNGVRELTRNKSLNATAGGKMFGGLLSQRRFFLSAPNLNLCLNPLTSDMET